jgi:hypothetical protein
MALGTFTEAFNYVSTTAAQQVGAIQRFIHDTYGVITCIYIYNGEASASIVQGDVVRAKTSTLSAGTGVRAATNKLARQYLLGVADHTIAAGSYGWIIKDGRCQVQCDGSVAADAPLMCNGTAGRAATATLTNADEVAAVFGVSLEADGAAGSLADAIVHI